jgi:hypothetical protein
MTYEQWAPERTVRPLLAFAKATLKPKVYRRRIRVAACRAGLQIWHNKDRQAMCRMGIDRAYGRADSNEKYVAESNFFKEHAHTDGRVYGQDAAAVRLARNGKNEFFERFLTDGGSLAYPNTFRDVCPYPRDNRDVIKLTEEEHRRLKRLGVDNESTTNDLCRGALRAAGLTRRSSI